MCQCSCTFLLAGFALKARFDVRDNYGKWLPCTVIDLSDVARHSASQKKSSSKKSSKNDSSKANRKRPSKDSSKLGLWVGVAKRCHCASEITHLGGLFALFPFCVRKSKKILLFFEKSRAMKKYERTFFVFISFGVKIATERSTVEGFQIV